MYWLKEVDRRGHGQPRPAQLLAAVRLQGARPIPTLARLPAHACAPRPAREHDAADHRPVREDHARTTSRPRGAKASRARRRPATTSRSTSRRSKLYADGKGNETEAPLRRAVRHRRVHRRARQAGLHRRRRCCRMERQPVKTGKQTVTHRRRQAAQLGRRRSLQQAHRPQLRRQRPQGRAPHRPTPLTCPPLLPIEVLR